MHPQIRMTKPGKCPICGMNLIPLKQTAPKKTTAKESHSDQSVQLSDEAVALAHIQTTRVSRQLPVKELSLYGTVQPDERLSQSQTAHLSGRVEKLFINFVGERVRRGETIATLYSPELYDAQQELIEASKMQATQPQLLQAAKEKLRLWKLSDRQINAMQQSGQPSPYMDVKATTDGIVVSKRVNTGDYVNRGSVLFEVADLSRVWILLDAYESDLPFLHMGDRVSYVLQALPGKHFSGRISFLSPVLDAATRTAQVRIEVPNPNLLLTPQMYATATVEAPLSNRGDQRPQLVIPKSAVLWTGQRSIVYVKQPDTNLPTFKLREVTLGPSLGEAYVITSGLQEGDEIVTNGVFALDASAQLEGKQSMMEH
jgi:Cu(I)/Ag(I) efflux system membrane fusion protein